MKRMSIFLVLILGTALAVAPPSEHVHLNMQDHAAQALKFLSTRSDARNIRFLSMYNYCDDSFLETAEGSQAFWTNNLHNVSTATNPKPVPGTDRTLWWIDLRDYGWNAAAFSAVARREPYFVEPNIDHRVAVRLRAFAGIDQDPVTNHVEVIVRADWFFRETAEADRSPSYYDLLFAPQRFIKIKSKSKSKSKRKIKLGRNLNFRFVNFPKNEKDFEKFYGIDKFDDFVKKSKIDPRHGAVVDGQENGVSVVSRQNRLLERKQSPIGAYYKTYDVKETSGERDFIETLQKNFKFEAGEILAVTPCGGMATLLVNNKGTILQTADNRFATDNADLRFDSRVRTGVSCFICHEKGFIAPKNLVKELLDLGIKLNVKKKKDFLDTKGFFLDWEHKLEADQNSFIRLIGRTSGFSPAKNALSLKQWRDKYDSPVGAETGAREFGLSVVEFQLLAAKSTRGRAAMLAHGLTIPRRTWEKDVFPELMRIKVARNR